MTRVIKNRAEWTTTPEGFGVHLNAKNVKGAVFHYPGDGNVARAGTTEAFSESLFRAYRNYHVNGRKWPDIGYNFGIDQAGRIWSLAGRKKAAHTASSRNPYANYHYVGILLLIGNNETPTKELIASANWLLTRIDSWYGINEVLGHRDVFGSATACPGTKVTALIKAGTIGLRGSTTVKPTTPPPATSKTKYAKRKYTKNEVTAIQKALQYMGYYNRVCDGDYGWWTAEAVKAYQKSQLCCKLVVDGDWGPVVQAHYTWVRELQGTLNKWKSSFAKLPVDGDYRSYTRRRVRDVQARNKGGAYKGNVDSKPNAATLNMLKVSKHP